MISKLLLTLLVILGAYAFIRMRITTARAQRGLPPPPLPWPDPQKVRLIAMSLAGLMLLGLALQWFELWRQAEEIITVQIVNANTGAVTSYEARRGDIEGRRIRTLDGKEIRLADVERMIILPPDRD